MQKFFKNLLIVGCVIALSNSSAYCDNCDKAEALIRKAEVASNREQSYDYVHKAREILLEECEENPLNIRALLDMSKVNQMLEDRLEAKVYVLIAYNLHPENPSLQKAMGDFYYAFQEYSTAIEYYKLSLSSGNLHDFETNLQTAKCYEKLADIENSELYYKICGYLNPDSRIVSNKLNEIQSAHTPDNSAELDKLKYKYLFKDRPQSEEEQDSKEIDDILNTLNGDL